MLAVCDRFGEEAHRTLLAGAVDKAGGFQPRLWADMKRAQSITLLSLDTAGTRTPVPSSRTFPRGALFVLIHHLIPNDPDEALLKLPKSPTAPALYDLKGTALGSKPDHNGVANIEFSRVNSMCVRGQTLMSNIRDLVQVLISRPSKINIVWTNQSCRTDCNFDPQLVKE